MTVNGKEVVVMPLKIFGVFGRKVGAGLCDDLSCYECWRRAAQIVMEYYFGGKEDGKKKN